ncbi:3'(2'),5'-bisphosphate nucleotidase CysQ [Ciceribacter sp. L1K22]|uniref:3'(2'),5'-bisphosphate nucleotidase CysQ n=1 Tax=Ciceribacter sp. L1K22 TaxID=2820275 RepID=UPI001ABD9E03|nr:3'(2'),5'-bisphosphate nucleotidase CysQ [Ciceribacter sp. L1K22]MBO3759041.1 3'(2'),5'-bisphosphate nucleotidase CysQ [Ciceribacter sp. L1K22]
MVALAQTDWLADLALIGEAARRAGEVALSYFGQSPDVWFKNEGRSPVSAADLAANEMLETMLRGARPGYGWLSEETDDDPARLSHDTVFVVDPIDGTRAFIAGERTWCVSVAVVHEGRPVAAALYAPALSEEYLASTGGAVRKNGEPIEVAGRDGPRLRVATPQDMLNTIDPMFREGLERVAHIPSLAYRIAMVADGRIHATFVKRNSHDWDLAAADLILERAGGRLTDSAGSTLQYNRPEVRHEVLCAAAAPLLPSLLAQLAPASRG